jgi:hypothetical protein
VQKEFSDLRLSIADFSRISANRKPISHKFGTDGHDIIPVETPQVKIANASDEFSIGSVLALYRKAE